MDERAISQTTPKPYWTCRRCERPPLPMALAYQPTEMECRCLVCGATLGHPGLWLDELPPDRRCPEGAKVVADCQRAMQAAQREAWLLKERANHE